MVAALSTGHEIGLAVAGAIFICFALLSSFYFPSRNPDFPSRQGLRWYVPLSVVFFLAMMASVIYFGREKKEAAQAASPPAASTTSGSTTTTAPAATGNPAAGKTVFAANGCAACHTFGPAGATGKVGPDLDDLQAEATKANRGSLDAFVKESIVDPGAYIAPGYPNAMPPTFGKSLSATQLNDLVAFLTQGK